LKPSISFGQGSQHVFLLCLIIDALEFYFYFWVGVLGGFESEMYWLMDGRVIVMRDCYGEDA
jgi:hypothetical protein